MASSYRTDQFFGLGITNGRDASGEGSFYAKPPANGFHKYPDRTVRTEDHNGYDTTILRRGYMRSLRTQADGIEVDVQKCAFQFNPSVLEQSVVQAEGLLNVFQSDPSQYAQPIPGNVSFGFELRFDRTMEVNNPTGGLGVATAPQFNTANPWELSDPSQVGVLRDLAALYAVIGQGIGEGQNEYLQKVLSDQLARENNDAAEADAEYNKKVAAIPDFLSMNTGNVAFLLPVPVRIVFSSLYIVEGFVQSTSVQFTKFSTQMIPLQCSVAVNVDAKYIGFAKKDTFLSASLAQEIKDREADNEQVRADTALVSGVMSSSVPSVTVFASSTGSSGPITLQDLMDATVFTDKWEMVVNGPLAGTVSVLGEELVAPTGSWPDFHTVYKPWSEGTFRGARVNSNITVYGPYTSNPGNTFTTSEQLKELVTPDKLMGTIEMIQGNGSRNLQASTYDEFSAMMTQAVGGETRADIWGSVASPASQYYIVKIAAAVYVNEVRGFGEVYKVITPSTYSSFQLSSRVSLSWPTIASQSTSGPSVPADNAASTTSRTAPSSSSRVGSGTTFRS